MAAQQHPFSELIARTTTSAIHLETRDVYTPGDPDFIAWKEGRPTARFAAREWFDLVRTHTDRGVRFRRARIVSEPITDSIRYEYENTAGLNVAAGEQVRWLPRRMASDLLIPGNDFWVFDDHLVELHHFSGDGEIVEDEWSEDPALVKLCTDAFEAVWARAIDHADYHPG